MTRNEILIEKYQRRIKDMEKRMESLTPYESIAYIAKINVYKMVIIDLQD